MQSLGTITYLLCYHLLTGEGHWTFIIVLSTLMTWYRLCDEETTAVMADLHKCLVSPTEDQSTVGDDGQGNTHLSPFHADNPVQIPRRVVEERNGNRRGTRRHPRAFRLWVYVEHVRLAREDRLLTAGGHLQLVEELNFMVLYSIFLLTLRDVQNCSL